MTTIKATPGTSVNINGASFTANATVTAYERTVPVRPVKVCMICSACQGEFLPTGMVKDMNPQLYEHCCNGCGNVANLTNNYPHIRWEDAK